MAFHKVNMLHDLDSYLLPKDLSRAYLKITEALISGIPCSPPY